MFVVEEGARAGRGEEMFMLAANCCGRLVDPTDGVPGADDSVPGRLYGEYVCGGVNIPTLPVLAPASGEAGCTGGASVGRNGEGEPGGLVLGGANIGGANMGLLGDEAVGPEADAPEYADDGE